MLRAEKNGFVLTIEGTWFEIFNKHGVVQYGSVVLPEVVLENYAEQVLDKFIEEHSVKDIAEGYMASPHCVKMVAYDEVLGDYVQLQAVNSKENEYYLIQKYDSDLVYMGEEFSGCKYCDEVKDFMRTNYKIVSGLTAEVYKNPLGDCTNGGISSKRRSLYILAENCGPFEPSDIRECVSIVEREVMGQVYVNAKPIYRKKRWYMAGGNFLYTGDSRYKEITGISYPVSIHDRCEG